MDLPASAAIQARRLALKQPQRAAGVREQRLRFSNYLPVHTDAPGQDPLFRPSPRRFRVQRQEPFQ